MKLHFKKILIAAAFGLIISAFAQPSFAMESLEKPNPAPAEIKKNDQPSLSISNQLSTTLNYEDDNTSLNGEDGENNNQNIINDYSLSINNKTNKNSEIKTNNKKFDAPAEDTDPTSNIYYDRSLGFPIEKTKEMDLAREQLQLLQKYVNISLPNDMHIDEQIILKQVTETASKKNNDKIKKIIEETEENIKLSKKAKEVGVKHSIVEDFNSKKISRDVIQKHIDKAEAERKKLAGLEQKK